MHFLPGYCWKYGAEYFLWCFKPICSGNLIAGPCALHSRFQFAVAWSATHSSWDAPKWEVLRGAGNTKTQGTRNISLGSSREAASVKGLFYEKSLFVGDGGTACAWLDFVSLTVGWACRRRLSPACAKGWMLNQIFCTSLGSNFSHQGGLTYRWDDGILLNIHPCLKCDNTQLSRRAVCGLGACGWDMRCLLHLCCSRDSCVLGNVCGKVRAIAIGVLKIEA